MSGFREMLTSEGKNGSKLSSKRVITFIAFILVCVPFVINIGWAIVVDPTILSGMINIVFAGLGVTVGEHILKKRNGENPDGIDGNDDDLHDNHGGSSSELGDN